MDTNTPSKPKTSPKDFFLYLGTAVTLYVSAGSLLRLFFAMINAVLPDPAIEMVRTYGQGMSVYDGTLRFAIASLVIVFPLYLFLSWRIRSDIARNPEKTDIAIRRWFVYFTLFLAGALAAGDLIALLTAFLGGELTVRFLLKVLAVLIVAAAVFSYYLFDLRRTAKGDLSVRPSLVWSAAGLVLLSIIGGFAVLGSPKTARLARFDDRKISDLTSIQSQLIFFWQQKGALPASLAELNNPLSGFMVPADPQTGAAYEYRKTGDLAFELCAVFSTIMAYNEPRAAGFPEPMGSWDHPVGRSCFSRTIDPDLYPVRDTLPPKPTTVPVPAR
jgi:hypothetical protein